MLVLFTDGICSVLYLRLVERATLNNLANAYYQLGGKSNLEQAINYQLQVVQLFDTQGLNSHPNLIFALTNLAIFHLSLGGQPNILKAIDYKQKALTILESQPDQHSPNKIAILERLAYLYEALSGSNNLAQAIKYYEKALAILDSQPQKQETLNESEMMENRVSQGIKASLLTNLASVYHLTGGQENLQRAINCYQRALTILEQQLGESHPSIQQSKQALEVLNKELKELEKNAQIPNSSFKFKP